MKTRNVDSLRFTETGSGYGLYDSVKRITPWRFIHQPSSGRVEAWVKVSNIGSRWEIVTTLPTDTPVDAIEAVLRTMAVLGLDTGD